MKYIFAFLLLLVFCSYAFASTSRATISDDAILARLESIDSSMKELKDSLADHKSTSDTKLDAKNTLYDTQISALRDKTTGLEMQMKIIWGILGLGTVGGGSIYGGMRFQQRKNGTPK